MKISDNLSGILANRLNRPRTECPAADGSDRVKEEDCEEHACPINCEISQWCRGGVQFGGTAAPHLQSCFFKFGCTSVSLVVFDASILPSVFEGVLGAFQGVLVTLQPALSPLRSQVRLGRVQHDLRAGQGDPHARRDGGAGVPADPLNPLISSDYKRALSKVGEKV